jgi:hypothetical protein
VLKLKKGLYPLDFRDIYPEGLPQELKEVLEIQTPEQ